MSVAVAVEVEARQAIALLLPNDLQCLAGETCQSDMAVEPVDAGALSASEIQACNTWLCHPGQPAAYPCYVSSHCGETWTLAP